MNLQTPVLLMVFNRPEKTRKVVQAIREVQPARVYIAADGPRDWIEGEAEKAQEVRQIATAIDWPCDVKLLFREHNLGCKHGPATAIDWFFAHEEEGVILEDDCVPCADFFQFCAELLTVYRHNPAVWAINGVNFQNGKKRGSGSYYFSRYFHGWGWATWRRAWEKADLEIRFWPAWKESADWKLLLPDRVERQFWSGIFEKMYLDAIDAWDYPWVANIWYHSGLVAAPNVNLVSNIGFDAEATHTFNSNALEANRQTESMTVVHHPESVERSQEADSYSYNVIFGGRWRRFPLSVVRFSRIALGLTRRRLMHAVGWRMDTRSK